MAPRLRRGGSPIAGACLLAALCLWAAGCGWGSEPSTTTSSAAEMPAAEPVAAPAEAADLPRVGDPGTRFGYNDDLLPSTPELLLVPASGADMVRTRLSWTSIERQPGQLDWGSYDLLYEQLLALGVRPLWVLVDAPCWAADGGPECDPSGSARAPSAGHADDLGRFLAAVAARYPESLGIEVGNEVDDPRFWRGGQDPEAYAALLKASAVAIHGVDPEMAVVAAGLFPFEGEQEGRPPWRDFMQAIVASGTWREIDAFAFHPYPRLQPGADPGPAVGALVDEFSAYVDGLGAGDVPIWVTEIGLSTLSPATGDGEKQAAGLTSIVRQLGIRGVPVVVIHRLTDTFNPDFSLEAGFGVVDSELTPKPAYCALAAARGKPCA